jgi:hypothetical protein
MLTVRRIDRDNILGYARLTVEADCLDPSPNLHLLRAQIETADAAIELLRRQRVIFDDPAPDPAETERWRADVVALLKRIDAIVENGE